MLCCFRPVLVVCATRGCLVCLVGRLAISCAATAKSDKLMTCLQPACPIPNETLPCRSLAPFFDVGFGGTTAGCWQGVSLLSLSGWLACPGRHPCVTSLPRGRRLASSSHGALFRGGCCRIGRLWQILGQLYFRSYVNWMDARKRKFGPSKSVSKANDPISKLLQAIQAIQPYLFFCVSGLLWLCNPLTVATANSETRQILTSGPVMVLLSISLPTDIIGNGVVGIIGTDHPDTCAA